MNGQCLFNFRANCLVRMSKDDIIDQKKIGQGNDAVVYKAKEKTENGQWRAVKKIHRRYLEKEEYLLTEIQILKKLDHPGVLKIFQVFDDSQYVFIVTELCEGNSLLQQLRRREYFEEEEAKVIFKRIIEIISYCHQNKTIHRDLKLENLVYCSKENTPQSLRLIDFGMSFNWETNARVQVKNTFSTNKVVGTIYYMAPQIYKQTYDQRVDIWSAGVILFFLLSGELPFVKDSDQQILQAIEQRKVPYEKLEQKECSKQVIDLLKRMFQVEHKRISVEQILKHPWFQSLTQQNHRLSKQTLHYFSLIPFQQFEVLEDYYKYCRQQIFQLEQNRRSDSCFELQGKNIIKTINWNNVYQFLKMSDRQKAIKIHLSYRLGHNNSHRLIKIFDHFKSIKKERIQLQTLYEHLHLEYEYLLNQLGENTNGNSRVLSSANKTNRKMSFEDQKVMFSIMKVYKELLSFFKYNKHQSVGYTMFVALISDYSEFNSEHVQFLKKSLNGKCYEKDQLNLLETEIQKIHEIVQQHFLQKKKNSKSQYSFAIHIPSQGNGKDLTNMRQRELPKLTLNLPKDSNTNLCLKKTPKKTIKQNILESISPTFIRRNPIAKAQYKGADTQRPKGSQLLQTETNSDGFLFGINKILSYF